MARRGDLYENTVTGERAVVLRGDEAPELPLLFPPLAAIARRRGHRGLYPELLGPHGTARSTRARWPPQALVQ